MFATPPKRILRLNKLQGWSFNKIFPLSQHNIWMWNFGAKATGSAPDGNGTERLEERDEVVHAIYADLRSFAIGSLAVVAAACVTAVKTESTPVWAVTAVIAVVTLVRLATMLLFARHAAKFSVTFWENIYLIAGTIHVASVGFWPAIIFWTTNDTYAEILSISAFLCFLVGIQGRNFASPKIVRMQILASAVPIAIMLASRGSIWYIILFIFFAAFLFTILATSMRMSNMFLNAVRTARENERLAFYDPLTGLPNRAAMEKFLAQALEDEDHSFALHFIDLDRFKRVNDTLGHSSGDELLKEAGHRLTHTVGSRDRVARYGGDEFVVLQRDASDKAETLALAREMVATLGRPFKVNGFTLQGGGSVGTAIFPDDGKSALALKKCADTALYHAKALGRGRNEFFTTELADRGAIRLQLENALRDALDKKALTLCFQPIVEPKRFRIVTCEALVRWSHPQRGPIPPSQFLPIAEETGLMNDLTDQTIGMACRAASNWPSNVNLAVNLSPSQLHRSDIVDVILRALRAGGLLPSRLEIEITENIDLDYEPLLLQKLWELKSHGIRLSLDDFGTGYSNLGHISRLPLDKIKIDKSFLSDSPDSERNISLLRGAIHFIALLELDIVVEGVETVDQLSLVASEPSVTELQGFVFGTPLPESAICDLLRALQRRPAVSLDEFKTTLAQTMPRRGGESLMAAPDANHVLKSVC